MDKTQKIKWGFNMKHNNIHQGIIYNLSFFFLWHNCCDIALNYLGCIDIEAKIGEEINSAQDTPGYTLVGQSYITFTSLNDPSDVKRKGKRGLSYEIFIYYQNGNYEVKMAEMSCYIKHLYNTGEWDELIPSFWITNLKDLQRVELILV